MDRPRTVGMAWFARADYPRLLDLMHDSDRLPEIYDAWRMSAEQVEGVVAGSGVAVVRVPVEPEAFAAWCAARDLRRDGAARARFATEAAQGSGE